MLVHAALDDEVEVEVSGTKHARRAKVMRVTITRLPKVRGQSGHMGFCKESIRNGRFGRACMRRRVVGT